MLCAIVDGPSFDEAKHQIEEAKEANLFEFRIDLFQFDELHAIRKLQLIAKKPVIFTLRPKTLRGGYGECESSRLKKITLLCSLLPNFVDIENYVERDFIYELKNNFPSIKMIISYHNYEETPSNISELYYDLKKIPGDYYKIATFSKCTTDSFRLMLYLKTVKDKMIGVCMGELGLLSRILYQQFNSSWTYASSKNPVAPGQMTIRDMIDIYGQNFNQKKQFFGLIGLPVNKSISHFTHNRVLEKLRLDALYFKMEVPKDKLHMLLQQFKEFGWKGLSVTMPFKEVIMDYLDEIDEDAKMIGAVNTIHFKDSKLFGCNTDGKGALDALQTKCNVKGKKMAILGLGGAAKAIAYEAKIRDAHVDLFGRNPNKIKDSHSWQDFIPTNYDIIINATPLELPFDPAVLEPQTILMDINTLPMPCPLLQRAYCHVVHGYEMFFHQAAYQFKLWFPDIELWRFQHLLKEECIKVIEDRNKI